jgi:hypothetical protein
MITLVFWISFAFLIIHYIRKDSEVTEETYADRKSIKKSFAKHFKGQLTPFWVMFYLFTIEGVEKVLFFDTTHEYKFFVRTIDYEHIKNDRDKRSKKQGMFNDFISNLILDTRGNCSKRIVLFVDDPFRGIEPLTVVYRETAKRGNFITVKQFAEKYIDSGLIEKENYIGVDLHE